MLVNGQVPVVGDLIITTEVGIFLLLGCFSSPGGDIFKSFQTTRFYSFLILCSTTQIENVSFVSC